MLTIITGSNKRPTIRSIVAALMASAAAVAGEGTLSFVDGGALYAGDSAVDGTGTTSSTGAGALAAGAAHVAGVGTATLAGAGALAAGAATVAGAGTAGSTASGTGALAAQAAHVAGVGTSSSTGAGTPAAQAAHAAGVGTSSSTGAGALAAGAAAVAGVGTVTTVTSYANTGGTGARSSTVTVTSNHIQGGGLIGNLVDGDLTAGTTHSFFFNNGTTDNVILFDFAPYGKKVYIDEFKWYQDLTTSHGTWHWEGYDGSAWVDLGSFTLGGATTQTQAVTGTTAYLAFRLRQTSGSASSACYCKEIEFKIADGSSFTATSTSYANTLGTGARTGTITATFDGTLGAGTAPKFVDGSSANDLWWNSQTGKVLSFDLGSAKIINELRWVQSNGATHGIQWMEASNDNSTWTQISGFFQTSGGAAGMGGGTTTTWQFSMNTGSWRYYRLHGPTAANGGTTSSSPFLYEAEFKIN